MGDLDYRVSAYDSCICHPHPHHLLCVRQDLMIPFSMFFPFMSTVALPHAATAKEASLKRVWPSHLNTRFFPRRCDSSPRCGTPTVSKPFKMTLRSDHKYVPSLRWWYCVHIDLGMSSLHSYNLCIKRVTKSACTRRWSVWLWRCWRKMDARAYGRNYRTSFFLHLLHLAWLFSFSSLVLYLSCLPKVQIPTAPPTSMQRKKPVKR